MTPPMTLFYDFVSFDHKLVCIKIWCVKSHHNRYEDYENISKHDLFLKKFES